MLGIIYVLIDPRTSRIRYVGQTTRPLRQRISAHMSPSSRASCDTHASRWLSQLAAFGIRPCGVPILAAGSKQELDALEVALIAHLRSCGVELVNSTDGGEGTLGFMPTEATMEKLRPHLARVHESKRGKSRTPEERAAIRSGRASGKKPKWTDERRAAFSAKMTGRAHTPEAIARMSAAKIGTKHSAETLAKLKSRPHLVGIDHPRYRVVDVDAVRVRIAAGETREQIAASLGMARRTLRIRLREE